MSLLSGKRRGVAGGSALAVLLGSIGLVAGPMALPASAADCTTATITVDTTCTVPGTPGMSRLIDVVVTGGGGGAFQHSNSTGGGGAVVTAKVSFRAGETLSIYVGRGGAAAIDSEDRSGGAGGGSSAVVAGSTLLVEAGGGGGAAYESQYASGGGGGDAAGAGFDSYQLDTDDPPNPCYPTAAGGTGGKGGNKTGGGDGGVPGMGYPSCSNEAYASGQAGFAVDSETTPGQGGAGGWTTNADPLAKGFGGGPVGGLGYRKGGDGGRSTNNKSSQGGGGGGGYGGGGGGVGTGNDKGFAGGGGGSYVNPLYAPTPTYGTAGPGSPGAGGCRSGVDGCPTGTATEHKPGVAGQVELALATGPSAQTETSPADVPSTGTSATLHSMANGTGDGPDTMTVRVSKSATFASGVLTATSSPSTPPDSDTAITSTISGLDHSTKYYYQIIVSNNAGTVYGLVEDFTTPSPPVVVTKKSAPTEITGTSAKVHSSVTTTVSNAVPIIKYSKNSSMTPVLGTATVAPGSVTAGAGATNVQGTITGLSPDTKYYYRAQAANDVGTTLGAVENFTTLPPPTVVTAKSAPTSVTTSGAIVHSSVKTSGSAATPVIKYSKSPTLATILGTAIVNPTSVTSGGAKNVSGTITGLTGGTTYYYRTQATNAVGTAFGAIESFTTSAVPGLLRCPIAPNWARPANMPLPLGRPVVLVHSITTNPKCKLFISARPVRPRGDVRPPIQFYVNPNTGRVVALATTGNAWALVRAVATPVKNPYAYPSRWVARSWWS